MSSADSPADSQEKLNTDDIEALLNEASQSLSEATGDADASQAGTARPFALGDLSPLAGDDATHEVELLDEVEMDLRVELGRTQMRLEEVLRLRKGSVVALDKLAGDPVDIYANGRLIARGEVLVMNDNFCVRVTELVGI
ncbi:flagellar motor switch protein FliN/FliY [Neorhodopirellula lusitana]|uniref:Flagellar motor switch protein FliN n=1 Tax=Neorhodopirellula lusitana TaxID=445327 RepID=A0ABY1QRW9_9BACT|nr:flagellar motor switch protein FliN [Neorhodopirellula lusitana]SMP76980.1 flagellar motor switch protein FliN/FliY [Neorhodopirellula lusitana]